MRKQMYSGVPADEAVARYLRRHDRGDPDDAPAWADPDRGVNAIQYWPDGTVRLGPGVVRLRDPDIVRWQPLARSLAAWSEHEVSEITAWDAFAFAASRGALPMAGGIWEGRLDDPVLAQTIMRWMTRNGSEELRNLLGLTRRTKRRGRKVKKLVLAATMPAA